MFYNLMSLFLAPLLLLQGLYVRRTRIVLPEADGARCGTLGSGVRLSVLIAGDSAAAGVGVDSQDRALTGYFTRELAKQYCVKWRLIAKSGSNTGDLTQHLCSVKGEEFDIVLLSLGVNDVLSLLSAAHWSEQLSDLTTLLLGQFGVKQIWFTSVPPMDQFPLLPHPLRWCLGRRSHVFNRVLEQYVVQNECCGLIDLRSALSITEIHNQNLDLSSKGEDQASPLLDAACNISDKNGGNTMAVDGFHPNECLYRLWGNSAARKIDKRLK